MYGCNTGEAKITKGYNLSAKFVIHTVGPIWRGGVQDEEQLLKNCYLSSLKVALNNNIKSIIEKFYELKEFDKEYQLSANLNITAIKVEDFVKDNKIQNEKFIDKAPEIDFNKLQNIILKYTSSLIVINCGEKELENINFAETLEVVLIALFNSKYNG